MSGRRSGKTTAAAAALTIRALIRKGLYWWVGPTAKQTEAGITALWFVLRGLPGVQFLRGISRFILPNASVIQFLSADANKSLVGFGLSGCVVDEAALIDRTTIAREIMPALRDHAGWLILCSTPRGYNWFADWREETLSRPDWEQFSFPTWANPSPETSEAECRKELGQMGEALWCQEHLGQPTAHELAMWPHEFMDDILVDSIPRSYGRSVLAVDFSEGKIKSDWQALVMLGHAQGKHHLDCRARRTSISALLREAKEMTDFYGVATVVFDASGGQALVADQVNDIWPQKPGAKPTIRLVKETVCKETRIQRLAWLLDRKSVVVLNNHGGREYQREGRDFPVGDYDDLLDAHELALRGLVYGG